MNKAILLVALFAFAGLASATLRADTLAPLWSAWKVQNKKTYTAAEEVARFGIFIENFNKINKLNAESEGVKYAINKFADLTATEFKQIYASGSFFENHRKEVARHSLRRDFEALPDSIDWRNKGAVTPVKDQGQCGSCWAFSTTGALEGFNFVNNGELLSFSEQQIVDCASSAGYGCQGGWPYLAVQYAGQNGLELESDYPYTAKDGTCVFDGSKAHKVNSGYQFVTPKSTDQLKAALVNFPVSVLIEADQDTFQFYSSGVIKANCGANLDHAVLAVGYQKVGLLEAFIVKNSWGTSWGSSGYVYISTIQTENQGQGVCGILAQPMIPTK
jgi:C1A family cysteine protease